MDVSVDSAMVVRVNICLSGALGSSASADTEDSLDGIGVISDDGILTGFDIPDSTIRMVAVMASSGTMCN